METVWVPLPRPQNSPMASAITVDNPWEMPTDTPPNSQILIIRQTDPNWIPDGPRSLPDNRTMGFPKEIAVNLAIELNRLVLDQSNRNSIWNVVAYAPRGAFTVIRIARSELWIPADEFDIPPDAIEFALTNMGARRSIVDFNRREMALSRSPKYWALHIKALRMNDR